MHTAYLLLGSNMGNREKLLQQALEALRHLGAVVAVSVMKETEPWGFEEEVPAFLNQAVCLQTALEPEVLLTECLGIEKKLGRERSWENSHYKDGVRTYSSRLIDIDILLYDFIQYNSKQLTIPHPRLKERPFAMGLLQEILPKNISLQDFY